MNSEFSQLLFTARVSNQQAHVLCQLVGMVNALAHAQLWPYQFNDSSYATGISYQYMQLSMYQLSILLHWLKSIQHFSIRYTCMHNTLNSASLLLVMALAKHRVHLEASITAHDFTGTSATSLQNCVPQSNHGVPSKSLPALTMINEYASNSFVYSGCHMVSTAVYTLKHITHSSIDVISFSVALGQFKEGMLISVGCGTPIHVAASHLGARIHHARLKIVNQLSWNWWRMWIYRYSWTRPFVAQFINY